MGNLTAISGLSMLEQGPALDRTLTIRFAADAACLRQAMELDVLSSTHKDAPRRILRETYFDTAAGDLYRNSILLLMRSVRSSRVVALKRSSPVVDGVFCTGEMEARTSALEPDISRLGSEMAAELSTILQGRSPQAQIEMLVKRLTRDIHWGLAEVRVLFDSGTVGEGDRRLNFDELALQLKLGDEVSLYDVAVEVTRKLPLQLRTYSLAEREIAFLSGAGWDARRAVNQPLPYEATVEHAIGVTIAACLHHFTANWPAFEESKQPEAVHQMRVALRRLRALLSLYRRALPCPRFQEFQAEATGIFAALGRTRDWDVFRDLVESGPVRHFGNDTQFASIIQAIEGQRKKDDELAQATISAPATTRFVLEMHAFLAHHHWQDDIAQPSQLDRPVRDFAKDILKRLSKRALKRRKRIDALASDERHRLRIAIKKIRYASECFGSLFDDTAGVRTYLRALANLQDVFGAYNDRMIALEKLQTLEPEIGADGAKAVGIIIGWYAREAGRLDKKLGRAWKGFRRTPTFW
jgi:CHAD domain-containing protein